MWDAASSWTCCDFDEHRFDATLMPDCVMKFSFLLSLQRTLLINWIASPAFAIWILVSLGVIAAIAFIVAWLVLDKAWDVFTGILITRASAASGARAPSVSMVINDVPPVVSLAMLFDLIGTLLLPWMTAMCFLVWLR